MNKIILVGVVVVVGVAGYFVFVNKSSQVVQQTNTPSPTKIVQATKTPTATPDKIAGTVTKNGYLTCLTLKPAAPIQECVAGLKDTKGDKYVLAGNLVDIYNKMNEFQNTKLVTISGKLTSATSGFDAVGTITVSSFTY
ncbi:MAG: hypothetical protein Q8P69_00835 [bacterium]|nr:hypothetical protein [bacterium]